LYKEKKNHKVFTSKPVVLHELNQTQMKEEGERGRKKPKGKGKRGKGKKYRVI
jgi:hypothetical protein